MISESRERMILMSHVRYSFGPKHTPHFSSGQFVRVNQGLGRAVVIRFLIAAYNRTKRFLAGTLA